MHKKPLWKTRYSLKICGKRHAFCKVCNPEAAKRVAVRIPRSQEELDEHYAPGYEKSPDGTTMWERHAKRYNLNMSQPPLRIVGLEKTELPDRRLLSSEQLDELIARGERIGNRELRYYFGFTSRMITKYRDQQRMEKRLAWMTPAQREAAELRAKKRSTNEERQKGIIAMRLQVPTPSLNSMALKFGVSRQRICQILLKAEKEDGIVFPQKGEYKRKTDLDIAMKCLVCGKIRIVKESLTKRSELAYKFCDEHLMREAGYKLWKEHGIEYWKLSRLERNKMHYKYNPERRKSMIASARRWNEEKKKDPEYVKMHRERVKKNWEKWRESHPKNSASKPEFVPKPFIEVEDHDDDAWLESQLSDIMKKKNGTGLQEN